MTETGENPKVGIIDTGRRKVSGVMSESLMPTEGYKSTVGVYGGRLLNKEGKLVWDNTGVISKLIDRPGDIVLRNYDEHKVKDPLKLFRRHPEIFFRFLFPGPKRFRGNTAQVFENVQTLGLTDYYGLHLNGIEIKKPELFQKGIILRDIYRSDQINSEKLNGIDRFKALDKAARYIRSVHDKGPIGEVLVSDIIFQGQEGDEVLNPILNLPDIVYSADKRFPKSKEEQKATDMLDFLFSVGVEELRRSDNFDDVNKALKSVVDAYGRDEVIKASASLAKRGRLTLTGGAFSQHSKARLGYLEKDADRLRAVVIASCSNS